MNPLTVHVPATDDHVPLACAGRRGSNRDNPVALAMSAATGHTCYVSTVGVSVPGRFYASLPPWIAEKLTAYAGTGCMEAFAFVLCGERQSYQIERAAE